MYQIFQFLCNDSDRTWFFNALTFGVGFQYLPRDLANVNAWKPMFDPYNDTSTVGVHLSPEVK